jgi:signal peptidase I
VDFIQAFGVKIPEKQYLVLGDNHAISADSRVFGFIPEDNLQGAPSLIIWPPGSRLGLPEQKPYPLINTPRLIVWGTAAGIFLIWQLIHRRNMRRHVIKRK